MTKLQTPDDPNRLTGEAKNPGGGEALDAADENPYTTDPEALIYTCGAVVDIVERTDPAAFADDDLALAALELAETIIAKLRKARS